jgi:hypothetical protein
LTLAAFRAFCATATPFVLDDVRQSLVRLRQIARSLNAWIVDEGDDLLRVAQVTHGEDAYTELIGWLIAPGTHRDSARRRQAAFLSSVGLDMPSVGPVDPVTQLGTDDGIPDLVLHYPGSLVVVVEAKTGTDEHAAPSGALQTIAYEPAVRRRLGLAPDFPVCTVFLTLDGKGAANERASLTTYFRSAAAIAASIAGVELPEFKRAMFALSLSHLLEHGERRGDPRTSIRRVATCPDDDAHLAANLAALIAAVQLMETAL